MRICPKCGYQEPLEWRHDFWHADKDYCRTEDFRCLQPDLAKALDAGHKVVIDEFYAYRKRGKGKLFVERIPRSLVEVDQDAWNVRGSKMEKVKHDFDPFQQKLCEIPGAEGTED